MPTTHPSPLSEYCNVLHFWGALSSFVVMASGHPAYGANWICASNFAGTNPSGLCMTNGAGSGSQDLAFVAMAGPTPSWALSASWSALPLPKNASLCPWNTLPLLSPPPPSAQACVNLPQVQIWCTEVSAHACASLASQRIITNVFYDTFMTLLGWCKGLVPAECILNAL